MYIYVSNIFVNNFYLAMSGNADGLFPILRCQKRWFKCELYEKNNACRVWSMSSRQFKENKTSHKMPLWTYWRI